jgi:hypothetical protein
MQATKERVIDGLRITSTQLPPMQALVLSPRLLPLVAPLLNGITAAIAASGSSPEDIASGKATLSSEAVVAALSAIDVNDLAVAFAGLTDEALVKMMLKLLAGTMVIVDGQNRSLVTEDAINAAFAGRFFTMLRTAWFAIEVNFFPTGAGDNGASSPKAASRST